MKTLAERAGVKLPEEDESPEARRLRDKKTTLFEINKEAAKYLIESWSSLDALTSGNQTFRDMGLTSPTYYTLKDGSSCHVYGSGNLVKG